MYRLYDLRGILPGGLNADIFPAHTNGEGRNAPGTLSGMAMTLLVLGILFTLIAFAMLMGIWDSPVPEQLYFRLIPEARTIGH